MPLTPSNTPRPLYGEGGVFTWAGDDDIFSCMTTGQSAFARWLPSRGTNIKNDTVKHLSWIAPRGFTGATTYIAHLIAQGGPPGECDFGPAGQDFNVCEFNQAMGRITLSTDAMNYDLFDGIKYSERTPMYVIRGGNAGQSIKSDGDWALATMAMDYEEHINWNLIWGDSAIGTAKGMFDGIDTVITPGYVRNHAVRGSCDWTDPLVINGSTLTTLEDQVRVIKAAIRFLRTRMYDRGYMPTGDDMVILMNGLQWQYMADAIAGGSLVGYTKTDVNLQLTTDGWLRERERISSGGYGFGFIDVDGAPVPVIVDNRMGRTVTLTGPKPGVVGDVFILTKRFKGYTILEHQYLNWLEVKNGEPRFNSDNRVYLQNGMVRGTWIDENGGLCYKYGIESFHRIVCSMHQFQCRITSLQAEVTFDGEFESGSFTSPNYYAFNGQVGGGGTDLLVPVT